MDSIIKLIELLPNYDQIEHIVVKDVAATYILKRAISTLAKMQQDSGVVDTEEVSYLMTALSDKSWEGIHTGHFSEVPIELRKTYALACLFKIIYTLVDNCEENTLEKCSQILDEAQLVGCTQDLFAQSQRLIVELMDFFNDRLTKNSNIILPVIAPLERQTCSCDIPIYDCPTVSEFDTHCFQPLKPALLLNTISHWPALDKWPDLNYILRVAGNRTVPIEIGANYTTDEWSQQMVKIRDFLCRQFGTKADQEIEYLAQHELFEQIPALKADIRVPDYCVLGKQSAAVDIKAWLGPKGTISPMHYDPKHNLLCQVFGSKHIILAAPEDSKNLYPHESEFLSNTSQLNAADLDFAIFPLAANVKFYKVLLQPGDCLYMPPKWWHYVRSNAASFSVSFWWE